MLMSEKTLRDTPLICAMSAVCSLAFMSQRQGWTGENGEVEEDVFNHYCYFWHHLETREINIDGLEDDYDDFLFFL